MRTQSTEGEPWGQRQESPPSETTPFIIFSRFSLTSPSESLGPVTPGPGEIFKHRAKDSVGPSPGPLSAPEKRGVKS